MWLLEIKISEALYFLSHRGILRWQTLIYALLSGGPTEFDMNLSEKAQRLV
jgi:hypothetical protein